MGLATLKMDSEMISSIEIAFSRHHGPNRSTVYANGALAEKSSRRMLLIFGLVVFY
jgi:hypothetical protein